MIQLAFDIAVIAGVARLLVLAARTGLDRRSAGGEGQTARMAPVAR